QCAVYSVANWPVASTQTLSGALVEMSITSPAKGWVTTLHPSLHGRPPQGTCSPPPSRGPASSGPASGTPEARPPPSALRRGGWARGGWGGGGVTQGWRRNAAEGAVTIGRKCM